MIGRFWNHGRALRSGRRAALSVVKAVFTAAIIALGALALPAAAQVAVSDNVNLSLAGDLSTGYTGGFGDAGSSHGLGLGGTATLHGYYYNPQFLSFDFQPYYNRSQANSFSQSITDSSGFVATTNFFSRSHVPGSVSFNKTFDSTGEFGIPGVAGLETRGSQQTIGINWALLFPDIPTLRATYLITGNDASFPGTSSRSRTSSRTLSLNSEYALSGFQLRGFFGHGSGHSEFPGFLVAEHGSLDNGSNQFGGSVTHAIPLRGFWTAQATHSSFSTGFGNAGAAGSSNGSNTSLGTSVTVNPLEKLALGLNVDYQTNAFGALQQQIVQAGGSPLQLSDNSSTVGVNGSASYSISRYVYLTGQVSHRQQNFEGRHFAITQYGAGVNANFSRRLLGSLSFSLGANDTATQAGNNGAGLFANVNFARRFQSWDVSSNFNYSQSVQTLLALYTTSVYGYGGSVKRKFRNDLYWGASFIGNHSGLQRVAGSTSQAETVSTYLHYHRYNVNALYSKSSGVSVLTAQGLTPVPTGVPAPQLANLLLYNAKSYGGGAGATLKRLNLSVSYSKAFSDLNSPSSTLNTGNTILNARLRYRVRKMYLDSGYTRFQQNIGAPGSKPSMVNSYFVGISRWFNVF
jgi:hypothetical protein